MPQHYTWASLIKTIGQMELAGKDSKMAQCTRDNTKWAHIMDGVAKYIKVEDTTSESGTKECIMEMAEDMSLLDTSSKKGGLRTTN